MIHIFTASLILTINLILFKIRKILNIIHVLNHKIILVASFSMITYMYEIISE